MDKSHQVTMEHVALGPINKLTFHRNTNMFRGHCSCGAISPVFSTAGMVWGWETAHKDSERGDSETT